MSYSATRRKRFTAGVLAGAMALTVMPILGFTGVAGADHIETADPIGDGNVCEDAPETDPFTDVSDTDPAVDEIRCMVNTDPQITKGKTATTYEPNSSTLRGQMALFLERVADLAEANETSEDAIQALPEGDGVTPFTDISDWPAEHQNAIDRLHEAGITDGVTATEFKPGANVTRRQMAKFIVDLQAFVAGEDFAPTPSEDYFDDDNGDSGEEQLNILAEEGVFIGTGAGEGHNVSPGADITRRQMAFVLTRKLEVFFEADLIDRLFAEDDSNQTFNVSGDTQTMPTLANPAAPQASELRTCTVSGLEPGSTVDVRIFPTADVVVGTDNIVRFTDAGPDNVADENASGALIYNINGANVTPAPEVNDINAAIGTISVTFGGTVPADVTLVAWQDQPGLTAQGIDLEVSTATTPKAPRELFGTGCRTVFANEAPNGAISGTVASTSKDADLFSDTTGLSYFYDSNDVFQIDPDGAGVNPCVQVSMAVFEGALSPEDTFTGNYNGDPAFPSTFCLVDVAPANVGAPTLTGQGTSMKIDFTGSATVTADAYNIYRVIRPPSGVCPDFQSPTGRSQYTMIATKADPTPGAAGGAITHTDTGLTQNTFYCYAITTVDDGDESTGTDELSQTTGSTVDTGAPTITDVRAQDNGTVGLVDATDVHRFIFSEPMAGTIDDLNSLYRLQDTDAVPSIVEVVCGVGGTTCALNAAPVTINGITYAAGRVLTVTVGTPNTVQAGTAAGVAMPATVTNVSAEWDDTTGNQLDLAGSADKSVNEASFTTGP